ncbi:hypothetical protein [Thioclava sp. FTW29]|uniref:Uncharacterized protein n=1 Tax=Thioclava litoralis TaxID=3076557 RepID=A0ABZ1E637_9RHOB|nr:hypothetical protein RPE78_17095 [Thioclava sp. FTW29]
MKLSPEMRAELSYRLERKQQEAATDPALRPLPKADWLVLFAITALALLAALVL